MDIYAVEYLDTYTKQILSSGLNMNTILLNDNFQPNRITNRLEICQKIYTTKFLGQKFYTLKVRKLRLFLLKKKQQKCINISHFNSFFVKI